MDPDKDDAVRNCEFPGGHSNILKSAESKMWTALQTCDKNEGRRREAKPMHTNELIDLRLGPHVASNCLGE